LKRRAESCEMDWTDGDNGASPAVNVTFLSFFVPTVSNPFIFIPRRNAAGLSSRIVRRWFPSRRDAEAPFGDI